MNEIKSNNSKKKQQRRRGKLLISAFCVLISYFASTTANLFVIPEVFQLLPRRECC